MTFWDYVVLHPWTVLWHALVALAAGGAIAQWVVKLRARDAGPVSIMRCVACRKIIVGEWCDTDRGAMHPRCFMVRSNHKEPSR